MLQNIVEDTTAPWLLFGDLNEVVTEQEKCGGRSIWQRKLYPSDFMQSVGGVDLWLRGK